MPPALLVRRSLLTWRAGEGATGGVEEEVTIEKYLGTVLPHLRGKGARLRLENGFPGVENGAPGGSNFGPRGVRNGSLEGSWPPKGGEKGPRQKLIIL